MSRRALRADCEKNRLGVQREEVMQKWVVSGLGIWGLGLGFRGIASLLYCRPSRVKFCVAVWPLRTISRDNVQRSAFCLPDSVLPEGNIYWIMKKATCVCVCACVLLASAGPSKYSKQGATASSLSHLQTYLYIYI